MGVDTVTVGVKGGLIADVLISSPTACIPLESVDTTGNTNICGPRTGGVEKTKGLSIERREVELRNAEEGGVPLPGKV